MGYKYKQFTLEDRCEIARLRGEGRSIRQIAAALDRQPSSVARELKRNGAAIIEEGRGGGRRGHKKNPAPASGGPGFGRARICRGARDAAGAWDPKFRRVHPAPS